jgi:4-aminobutyrate aminotransferase / (S)-3-amino-2-methylpropionate transaminase / 5-aminovalerate transaminase
VTTRLAGDELARVAGDVPGPASIALAQRLARVESPNITRLRPPPIFWTEARGAVVRDADGNTYIDLTAGFGVAHAGHANPAVAAAIAAQAAVLAHGLGDVYPPEPKVRLLERLAGIAPGNLSVSILAGSGAEAVEAALKTAAIRTGRTGIIAFEGAYHGLTYGALATTWRADFRKPFAAQLFGGVRFAPYPAALNDRGADGPAAATAPGADSADAALADAAVAAVADLIREAEGTAHPVGAVIVEPILGRGGIVVPPAGFLAGLRGLCDGRRTLLLFDEVYTGCGRTGRWFACEHEGVVPDVLVAGKALTGSIGLGVAIGTPDAMGGWPPSDGEAIHTSTFLGNPVACAAALAQLDAIRDEGLLARSTRLGATIRERVGGWQALGAGPPRGRGMLQAVPVAGAGRALRVADRCLRHGVIVLAEGADAGVLAITPPAVITDAQLATALDVLEAALRLEPS